MIADISKEKCPLCASAHIHKFYSDENREYLQCNDCYLIFVPAIYFLSKQAEKQRYDNHQNNPADPNYRKFLNVIFHPMKERLLPESCGLDFGSGPGPTLSVMFQEAGHKVAIYDYFYAQDVSVLEKQYDFITATEVLEHLHHPQEELDRLWKCLKPGGKLGIMTKLIANQNDFHSWYYKNELTHICFFSKPTFLCLARRWQAEIDFIGNDVIVFYKKSTLKVQ